MNLKKEYQREFEKAVKKFMKEQNIYYDKRVKRYRCRTTGRFVDVFGLECYKDLT